MIKAIIFDWFGVCTKENWADCLARELHSRLDIDEQKIRIEFRKLLQPFARAELTPDEFLDQFIGSLDESEDPRQYSYLFSKIIPEINYDLLNFILKLKNKYTIYLLSNNFGPVFPNYEKQIQFDIYFDKLFLSHKLGISKTQTEIWNKVLPKIDFPPTELMFIDNKEKYFGPVSKLGVKTTLFLSNEQIKKDLELQGIKVG